MAGDSAGAAGFRAFEPVVDAVVERARRWWIALSARNELAVSSPQIASVAATFGIASRDGDQADGERPSPAPLLRQMLVALGLDPEAPALIDHAAMDELRRLCAGCEHKTACAEGLAQGTAAENFYAYCPNAQALDSIYVEMTFNRL